MNPAPADARRAARIGTLLAPAGWLYGAAARLHGRFARRRAERLACRVVSVGSLTVGGSGKTPLAAWVAAGLHRRGHKVVIASRGYGGAAGEEVVVVSDGVHLRSRVEAVGDEALVLTARAPGVPVLVGRDRARVGWRALSGFGAEVVVLDDGFQHHRLARDVDLVVFDGAGIGNARCLPSGPLREPLAGLARAHAVGVIDGPLPQRDAARVAAKAPAAYRFEASRRALSLVPLGGGESAAPASLAGRSVGLLCGLAQPHTLRRSVQALGARIVAERSFGDHHRYRPEDLRGLAEAASLWITTEKDAPKIPASWVGGTDVRVLAITLFPADPAGLLDWIEARMR